ncbi:oxygen-independent coproporphyrinogen III oxidase [Rhizobium oryzicola]|uniref:Coproporphyrinogen-III oxidase n=1 Tax=Rhizobium oryzicola TaxID=1232668 RepID=A0ABT8SSM3_9HYPH|nr:oxygen-independent coproporphyrinogen III oxidase [Rhizobium oryzicola]MDO1580868.1 oxygen-independent coproporphyrinogen III oxidase [Rhizobium oryzicola]
MNKDLLARYSAPVPRYTSYPTAPHFHDGVTGDLYGKWLSEDGGPDALSLYIHIPFCDRLCWYCGCHTKQIKRYEPVVGYVGALQAEIAMVAERFPVRRRVESIHFGGGSPTILSPDDLAKLREVLDRHFDIEPSAEISVEIDPGFVDEIKLEAWRRFGITRASVGVQDFDPVVQKAINRPQSFEQTAKVVKMLRSFGVGGINLDIVYGLPHQTLESLQRTLDLALSMNPDRFAIFGYAHVPWMKKHQTLIDEAALPGAEARYEMAERVSAVLLQAGYLAVGLDHFARAEDSLARALTSQQIRRNFQGYTTDRAASLIGFGASSIGRNAGGHVQNITATGEYIRAVNEGRLPVARGFALSDTDRAVGEAIEALMCHYSFSVKELSQRYGVAADVVKADAARLLQQDKDGFIRFDGDHFEVVGDGQRFVRTIASGFDQYFGRGTARHSVAV